MTISRVVLVLLIAGCATPLRRFPAHAPLTRDPDTVPFAPRPADREPRNLWDTVDNIVFEPLTSALALHRAPRAPNATALDEVADSSWFTNRIDDLAATKGVASWVNGPCKSPPPAAEGPWTIISGKPDGVNPGFFVKHGNGTTYVFKPEKLGDERSSTADFIGSRIYWAAGFNAPCNRVVFIDPKNFALSPDAKAEDEGGEKVPFTAEKLALALRSTRRTDGTVRGSLSELVEGEVLGPWADFGTRDDDPNDIIPHEDRRELRGSYVLAAWLSHYDAREQNSLDTWVKTDESRGYIKHYQIDFGDCFGSRSPRPRVDRRRGFVYEMQWPLALVELLTLGAVDRPWRDPQLGPGGESLGYFSDAAFDPENFHTAYPYGPFTRVTEADAAWGARILARIPDEAVVAMVDEARLSSAAMRDELLRVLRGRRRALLRRYLGTLSPLVPRLVGETVCARDLAVSAGIATRAAEVCVSLPRDPYGVVELRAGATLLRVHVTTVAGTPTIVGLERETP